MEGVRQREKEKCNNFLKTSINKSKTFHSNSTLVFIPTPTQLIINSSKKKSDDVTVEKESPWLYAPEEQ